MRSTHIHDTRLIVIYIYAFSVMCWCTVSVQYMADAIGLSRIFIKDVFSSWEFLIFFIYTKKMVAFTGKHNVLYLVGKRME